MANLNVISFMAMAYIFGSQDMTNLAIILQEGDTMGFVYDGDN